MVRSARAFVGCLAKLRKHGLSSRTAFWLLQAFSQGQVTHLLRANFEQGSWPREFDDALVTDKLNDATEVFMTDTFIRCITSHPPLCACA